MGDDQDAAFLAACHMPGTPSFVMVPEVYAQTCHLTAVSTYSAARIDRILKKPSPPRRGTRFEVATVAFLTIGELG